jgi:diacylglycerol kinase family enzyme
VSAVLIVNPRASRVTPERVRAVVSELERAGRLEVVETRARWHARELAAEASARGDTVFVFSGDGGFNEALNGLGDVPIGFLPGGGTSVLPRALGLPRDPVACARLLVSAGETRRISLGRVNGRRFAFSAGIGLDAAAVRLVDELGRSLDGRRKGDTAFLAAFGRLLRDARGRIEAQAEVVGHGRAAWVMVGNCPVFTYAGRIPIRVASAARFELGLDLVAPARIRLRSIPRLLRYGFGGTGQERAADFVYVHDADRLEVRCDRPLPLQTDGEDLGDVTEVVFEAERDAVSVLVGRA